MHGWFDILQDKYNAPYFIDVEKDEFINRAQLTFVNEVIYKELYPSLQAGERGPQVLSAIESTLSGSEILQPLIVADLAVTAAITTGKLLTSAIETAINGQTSDSTGLMHVLSVSTANPTGGGYTADRLVRFVRHNDIYRFRDNVFKQATVRNPVYMSVYDGFIFRPIPTSTPANILMTVIKYPIAVSLSGGQSCELPDFTHDKIMAIALEFAGLASRDEALAMLSRGQGAA